MHAAAWRWCLGIDWLGLSQGVFNRGQASAVSSHHHSKTRAKKRRPPPSLCSRAHTTERHPPPAFIRSLGSLETKCQSIHPKSQVGSIYGRWGAAWLDRLIRAAEGDRNRRQALSPLCSARLLFTTPSMEPPGAATWGSARPEIVKKIIVLGGKAVVRCCVGMSRGVYVFESHGPASAIHPCSLRA